MPREWLIGVKNIIDGGVIWLIIQVSWEMGISIILLVFDEDYLSFVFFLSDCIFFFGSFP